MRLSDAEINAKAITDYNNHAPCDHLQRFPWVVERQGAESSNVPVKTLHLSKTELGEFVYEVLKRKGDITKIYCFSNKDNDDVFPRVLLTLEARDDMIQKTGYILNPPVINKTI